MLSVKNRVIYDNSKNSSCFTTFHPYCLRFSCYTLGKKIRGLRTALKRKEGITEWTLKDPPADDTGGKGRLLLRFGFLAHTARGAAGRACRDDERWPQRPTQAGQAGRSSGHQQKHPRGLFPLKCSVASSFDTALAEKLGKTLGNECRAENLALLLGPG